ncbi:hypothetical protein [Streptomyces chattanoogensis]|uniref:hypothetical protein n=1 Tax=Streptomyces chattanoogensis TaxID=66876 RepID=UPI00369B630A
MAPPAFERRRAGAEAQAVYVQAVGKELLAALEEPELLARFAAARDGEDLGRLRPALPHLGGVVADPELAVRLTTGRARLTDAFGGQGERLARFATAGQEVDFDPMAAPLQRHRLEGGWVSLAELAAVAGVTVVEPAAVAGELVTAQAATVRAAGR